MDTLLRFGDGIINVYMQGKYDHSVTVYHDAYTDEGAFVPAQVARLYMPTSEQIEALIEALVDMNTAIVALNKAR